MWFFKNAPYMVKLTQEEDKAGSFLLEKIPVCFMTEVS